METLNPSTVIILGTAIFGGTLGAGLFQRIRIPQVVGYIVMGLIIGRSGFNFVSQEELQALEGLNLFALAVIGFLVGGELHRDTFKTYGKQFMAILFGEGLGAFFLVGIPAGGLVYYVTGSIPVAIASGLVFGAIASATDPATTIDVLWEYRTRGVLTTTIIAIVALDDALAMALYGVSTSLAQIITGQSVSLTGEVIRISIELLGATGAGIIAGTILNYLLRWLHQPERSLALAVGILLLLIGIAVASGMDVILATMVMGLTLTNLAPRRTKPLFEIVRSFSTPIYVLFFVLVGARLSVAHMPTWLWGMVAIYVVGRGAGKMAGAFVGAKISKAERPVQRYCGLGLFAQGGIAVGLSIMAAEHLSNVPINDEMNLADLIIFSITASTFVVQMIGPYLIKLAAKLADEIGRNVTEEDVIASFQVGDVMDSSLKPVNEYEPLTGVFTAFSEQEHLVLPVVGKAGNVEGVITLDALKEIVANQDTWAWLVAKDVYLPLKENTNLAAELHSALDTMREIGAEQMLVFTNEEDNTLAGILDSRKVRKRIQNELLIRQQAVATVAA